VHRPRHESAGERQGCIISADKFEETIQELEMPDAPVLNVDLDQWEWPMNVRDVAISAPKQPRQAPRIVVGMRASLILSGGLLLFATVTDARAVDDDDRLAIHDVIVHQMDSFLSDDAPGAFAYAAPAIQQMFHDPDTFMTMVRTGYAPVYRPKATTFGALSDTEFGVAQIVTIVDADGNFWTAIYSMEKEADGSWRISGCRLVKAPSA
jgi:hypothetical protein